MTPLPPGRYAGPPGVAWALDTEHVILVSGPGGVAHRVNGLAAAVWVWLSLGHGYERVVALAAAAGSDRAAVDGLIAWFVAQGLLQRQEERP